MKRFAAACLLLVLPVFALAQDAPPPEAPQAEAEPAPESGAPSVTQHEVQIGGRTIAYTATAGVLPLETGSGEKRAEIFYVAYTVEPEEGAPDRPLTFSFNGGPGSSSVWLHLGVFGPKRVELDAFGLPPPPPYRLVDNAWSILDLTDLVFIDPVSTGFSRPSGEAKADQFHGVQQDIESVGAFIRRYITRHNRWDAPKYIAGESYGTTRAAGLAEHLQQRYGMYLNGLLLVSTVLEFQTIRPDPGNDMPFVLFFPSFVAAAWYHQQLEPSMQQQELAELLRAAEAFAVGDLQRALALGAALPEDERLEIEQIFAGFTGLDPDFVNRAGLRVGMQTFGKRLLYDERQLIGRFDARYTQPDPHPGSPYYSGDPSLSGILGSFTANLKNYLREDLGYAEERSYDIFGQNMGHWKFNAENRYLNLATNLARAMNQNPALRVYVGSGLYDLATPYYATDYTLNRMHLPQALRKNLQVHYYEAGHMMYTHRPALEQMKRDLEAFYRAAPE